ncbi:hypothetical protein As57867_001188, partial [Aphanomyces stellatus]
LTLFQFNLLRVSPETELAGLDLSLHGGPAYEQGDDVKMTGPKTENSLNDSGFHQVMTPATANGASIAFNSV